MGALCGEMWSETGRELGASAELSPPKVASAAADSLTSRPLLAANRHAHAARPRVYRSGHSDNNNNSCDGADYARAGGKRRRLRRSSAVSSDQRGQSQESGGDLDIGPSVDGPERAVSISPVAAAASVAHALAERTLQVAETPALPRDGVLETALVTLKLMPSSALELLRLLEGCVSDEVTKLASSCIAYVLSHFERVVQCEAFLSLSFNRMQQIIADDELNVSSEDVSTRATFPLDHSEKMCVRTVQVVYSAVMNWVQHDIAQRQHAELDTLLRLVRHPATSSRQPLLEDELTLQHTELRCRILYQCQNEFKQSIKNIDNYQLRPRINCYGFREFDCVHPSITILAGGAAVRKEEGFDNMYASALCGTLDGKGVMTGGRHRMQFELLSYSGKSLMVGICSPSFQPLTNAGGAHYGTTGYAYNAYNGSLYHDAGAKRMQAKAMARDGFPTNGAGIRWKGSQKAQQGDKLDLCLDFEKGTLSLIKNGRLRGTLVGPSAANPKTPKLESGVGEGRGFVWMVEMTTAQDCVRVSRAKGSDNNWHSP